MKSFRNSLLAFFLCLGIPLAAHGASIHGFLKSNLQQLAQAIWDYYDTFKTFPTDIVDGQGKPLLSWRVRLLPFIEGDNLYKAFKLNEPWDSAHNKELIAKIPPTYMHPYEDEKSGKACVVAPRGPSTFFGIGKPRRKREIHNPLAVMLVGPEHAPIWTKPEDLAFDPANPEKGLGLKLSRTLKFVVLANKKICTIPDGTDPDLLRALFSIEEPVRLELHWHEVLNHPVVGDLIKGCFLISLAFIGACGVVIYRLLSRKPTSPGEMFFLIIAIQQMVFVLAFMMCYRYQVLPHFYFGNEHQRELWYLPGLAGVFAAIVPICRFRSTGVFWIFFALILLWFAILAQDSWSRYDDFRAEESLTTIGHPIFMALAAALMAAISHGDQARQAIDNRASWHWAGIAAAVVPLLWFLNWWSQGLVAPRELFMPRILD
jgi:hypothetical protein